MKDWSFPSTLRSDLRFTHAHDSIFPCLLPGLSSPQVEAKEKTFHTSFCGGKRISFTLTLVLTISIGLSYRQFLRSEIRSDYTRLSRRKVLSTVGTFQCLATSNNSCTGLATFGVRSGYKKEANQGVPRQLPSIDISYSLSIGSNGSLRKRQPSTFGMPGFYKINWTLTLL